MVDQTEGHLRLAIVADYLPESLLLGHLSAFRKLHPQISFTVSVEPASSIEASLIADRLSFAWVDRNVEHDFVHAIDFGTVPYVAVATAEYVKARGPFDRQESVLLGDLIDFDKSLPLVRSWLGPADDAMQAMLLEARPAFAVPGIAAALHLMTDGAGIAFLPRSLVASGLAAGTLKEVCPRQVMPDRPVRVLYRRRNVRLLVESLFLEHLLEERAAAVGP